MKKIIKSIAISLLIVCMAFPIITTALAVLEHEEVPTPCPYCKTGLAKMVYDLVKLYKDDPAGHYDAYRVKRICENPDCSWYNVGEVLPIQRISEITPHRTSPLPNQSPSSTTFEYRKKGNVHDRIQVRHYHCTCGRPFSTSQTVEQNRRHSCARHTYKNGVTTHYCICGANKKGNAHYN